MSGTGGADEPFSSMSAGRDWLSAYAERATEFVQRASQAGGEAAAKWGQRSLQDGEWTIDTVTADVIEAWETLTPFAGEGIELWLELVQRSMRMGLPDD